jgi:hypothetical protein
MYNTGSYVLGVLIARAASQSMETFLLEPLGSGSRWRIPTECRK